MNIVDFSGEHAVGSLFELEAILMRRHVDGSNAFWLAMESGGHPTLMILVKGNLAVLHYLFTADEPGVRSIGERASGEYLDFSISPYSADDIQEPSEALVAFDVAKEAAREFFRTQTLPQSVKWIDV